MVKTCSLDCKNAWCWSSLCLYGICYPLAIRSGAFPREIPYCSTLAKTAIRRWMRVPGNWSSLLKATRVGVSLIYMAQALNTLFTVCWTSPSPPGNSPVLASGFPGPSGSTPPLSPLLLAPLGSQAQLHFDLIGVPINQPPIASISGCRSSSVGKCFDPYDAATHYIQGLTIYGTLLYCVAGQAENCSWVLRS